MTHIDPSPLLAVDSTQRWARVRSKLWPGLGSIALVVVFAPVVFTQLLDVITGSDGRPLEGVSLDEVDPIEVRFTNQEQDLGLAGLLFVPEGEGPFPAAVIISGSGPGIRRNSWNLTVADHLQRNGIMVLLPDKRGSEQSEGNWQTSSFSR